MTHRERMLAALRGEKVDRCPWAPRMDLWYIALRAKDSMPEGFEELNTLEIAKRLGVACHSVRADYTMMRSPEAFTLRGLGLDNHPDYPYRVEVRDMEVEFSGENGDFLTTFHTSKGDITTHLQLTPQMARDGISLPFVRSYAIESVEDFEPVAEIFEHIQVIPTPDAYREFHERIGDQGLAVANGLHVASPVHLLLHDVMAMDNFYYFQIDHPQEMEELAGRMEPFFEAALTATLQSEAECFMWGGNFDQDITYPAFFQKDFAPWLEKVTERAHENGKLVVTHCDGENGQLMPLYRSIGFDAAESVVPEPMSSLTLKQLRDGMAGITIWGGIPAVALIPENTSDSDFDQFLDMTFEQMGDPKRLILGVSDNVPPDCDLDRLARIGERAASYP